MLMLLPENYRCRNSFDYLKENHLQLERILCIKYNLQAVDGASIFVCPMIVSHHMFMKILCI